MTEQEFAFRIRQALNEGADSVSYKASLRLEKARQLAVAQARGAAAAARPATVRLPALQLATAGGGGPVDAPGGGLWAWLRGAGLAAPLLVLVVGFIGIYEWHNRQFIEELADTDFAVLLDEAPIQAYADQGFGAMLRRQASSVTGHEGHDGHQAAADTGASLSDAEGAALTPAAEAVGEEAPAQDTRSDEVVKQ